MPDRFDIAILGGSPAGFAAACHLAGKKCSVVLLNPPPTAAECPLADWVSPEFFRLAGLPKSLAADTQAVAFQQVCYHSALLDREVAYASRAKAGYFLQTAELVKRLRKWAEKRHVTVHDTDQRPRIELREDRVCLVGERTLTAKLLLITQDRPAEALRELAMPLRNVPNAHLVTAGLDVPVKDRALAKRLQGILHVVESAERTELGMFFLVGSLLHLRMISSSRASGTRAAELSQMVRGLQEKRILPPNLSLGKARGAVWYPPAGMALELEAHVAKRCLLAGSAGGFADTITGHTLLPSVKSALLAADVALAALKSGANVQETLASFKTLWRRSLAEYLRPPNTSLQMLLPLLFANKRIVSRFTRALLYGEPI